MAETVSENDLRALLAVVEDGRRDEPNNALPWATLDALAHLVPCDELDFAELDRAHRRIIISQADDGGGRELEFDVAESPGSVMYWEHSPGFLPCAYTLRGGNHTRVVRWSDFYTQTELRNTPLYAEYYRPLGGGKHCLITTLPAAPGHTRRVLMYRDSGHDFTDREVLMLQLLRPHLYEVYLDAQRRRNGVPRLSRRELQVLQLAAQALSNADIARELFISVATVRKHLEHIYDRTGVRTRAAAAALVLPQVERAGNAHAAAPEGTIHP
ncbi:MULTISPECIES: response regulator transcription factor [Amycolatopsis]|uniref:HTH luxR-type domain-containing protein n=1 Tax=Amycolatopsis tucumanensis TaxID=401106 RepID=A0ABP7HH20_9PSEU|nr:MULTISPECIES: helix-turn-helix transcriptional regulator [Amycolatopsis]MCF6423534.1 helix-turn-helix transcriptional regulator [Amycolatopsis tucumanensis]